MMLPSIPQMLVGRRAFFVLAIVAAAAAVMQWRIS